jgi:hypothetical protein
MKTEDEWIFRTQWYCPLQVLARFGNCRLSGQDSPPAAGAMDAISAMDAIMASMQSHTPTMLQMAPPVPPLNSPK